MAKESKGGFLNLFLLTLAASLIYALSQGITNDYGIMLTAIIENTGLSYASVSFVIAVGQMFYGVVQPAFGMLAERKGSLLTLLVGFVLMLVGLVLIPFCTAAWQLLLCMGLILPAGTGAVSYGLIMGCITPKLSPKTVSIVSGIVNASSGIGGAIIFPATQYLIDGGGLAAAMFTLAVPTLLFIPLCFYIASGSGAAGPSEQTDATGAVAGFKEAFMSRTYRLLMFIFFVCGFHMTLIYSHLPSQFTSYGIPAETSAYAFSLYGLVTIVGSVLSGWLCSSYRMKNILGSLFASRTVIVIAFLLLPKTILVAFVFAALLGLTGASTVPPVAGIISLRFGAARLATLFGLVYCIHQIGAFFGAWLGGITYELFGTYVIIWLADSVLCALAAGAAFIIRK